MPFPEDGEYSNSPSVYRGSTPKGEGVVENKVITL